MTDQTPFPQPGQHPPAGSTPYGANSAGLQPAAGSAAGGVGPGSPGVGGPVPANVPSGQPAQKNIVGRIGLIAAIAGFIFGCIPGAALLGWMLLPVGFILGIVGVCLSGKKKGTSIAAIVISVVGTIVSVIVFVTVVFDAVDDAFSSGDTTVTAPDNSSVDAPGTDETDADADETDAIDSDAGSTRDNPAPLGATISDDDWSVTINSVDLNANEILAEERFNDAPADGATQILVNLTATYVGDDPEGRTPWVSVDYVTPDGNTITTLDALLVAPDRFDNMGTLYSGASTTGNIAFEVPADTVEQGVLAVTPGLFGDKVFVAVK